jgi:hypothetical protein
MGAGEKHMTEFSYAFAGIAGATAMMFSVAWFFSVFLTGAAIPFGLAVGATVASAVVIRQLTDIFGLHGYTFVRAWIVWSCGVAAISFVIGAISYARRVEP